MAVYAGPNLATNGLVLSLDAASKTSYPGTGTAWFDLSQNKQVANLVNGPTYNTSNQGFLSFDGTNDYGVLNTLPVMDSLFTNEIVFYPTNLTGGDAGWSTLLFQGTSTPRSFYFVCTSSGQLLTSYSNSAGTGDLFLTSDSNIIQVNKWHHVVQLLDMSIGYMAMFLNGVQVASVNPGSYSITRNSFITFGQQGTDTSSAFARRLTGRIASIRIYNKRLNGREIINNYISFRGRYNI